MGPVFLMLMIAAVLVGFATGRMEPVTRASLDSAQSAVEIAIGLVGAMALFLGLVRVLERAGLMSSLAGLLRPVFRRLFPGVPDRHPALGMMTLNISANMLGLGNAATPFGIEAMRQLDRLNDRKGVATDAMCLFLAINTSGVALLPLGVIGVRASLGSADPASIIATSLMATSFSTVVGIGTALLLSRLRVFRRACLEDSAPASSEPEPSATPEAPDEAAPFVGWRVAVAAALLVSAIAAAAVGIASLPEEVAAGSGLRYAVSWVPLPMLMLCALLYGWTRQVAVYEALVDGAKQGFQIALLIIPYLVAILVAVGMFRASGALDAIIAGIGPLTANLGFPPEALPMALVRPLSGSGALGVMTETMQAHGTDSFIGYLVSTLNGSTETTFYVLAVYGGAVGLRNTRHALPACLIADLAGVIGATAACLWVFG